MNRIDAKAITGQDVQIFISSGEVFFYKKGRLVLQMWAKDLAKLNLAVPPQPQNP